MIKRFRFAQRIRIQTLDRLNRLNDPEFIKQIDLADLSIKEAKRLTSDNLKFLYKKEIRKMEKFYLNGPEQQVGEKITYYYECEIKKLTKSLQKLHDTCNKHDISVLELETECVNFIVDKNKRFIFKSKRAQFLYNAKNTLAASSLGYWGYKAVTKLGSISPYLLKKELLKSSLPIAFFTGVTCKFWSYITKPIPAVSKTFNVLSKIALSPIWLIETFINKASTKVNKSLDRVAIPINIVGEINCGSGLTWNQLDHTCLFVKKMANNFHPDYFNS